GLVPLRTCARSVARLGRVLLDRAAAPGVVAQRAVLRELRRAHEARPEGARGLQSEPRLARLPAELPGRELARQSPRESELRAPRLDAGADRPRLVRDLDPREARPRLERPPPSARRIAFSA